MSADLIAALREVGISQQHIDSDFARSTLAAGACRRAADLLEALTMQSRPDESFGVSQEETASPLQAAQARIKVLEGALETFAILANEETDYLPDEHLISLTYDDSDLDDDLGGPNTLLGERFMRAFRRARAALLPQLGGENG